ncbi:MAG: glycosyltransferase family 4 protein [Xanthomonadaceae bacterium]|nr:glycosyltransferase family 4 protein [Xanthomonadaceae bacterium]MDE1964390.1 glycosyltransferase family 4 protein [Xanthomonadaceae bacterium]
MAIAYAHRRGMLDQPGQRRSHAVPTPRGGGVGIVLAVLLGLLPGAVGVPPGEPRSTLAAVWLGLLIVACTGWWDDHRSLPVLPRLAAQAVAVGLVVLALAMHGVAVIWLPLLMLAGIGSINLHNFMDGIDGLLAQQAMFVMAGLAVIARALQMPWATSALVLVAAATAGFWIYNRPPARIFMGDVGSGALGFLVFALGAMLWQTAPSTIWPIAVLCSAFVTDAGLTLLVRIWRGRRWYSAHREHLYQWMVRGGRSHGTVAGWYTAWNLLVAAPAACGAWRLGGAGWRVCVPVYGVSMMVWTMLKRGSLRRARERIT